MAECPVRIALVNQEVMRSGHIASPQIVVHKEGLTGAGRAQQKYVIVLNQPQLQGQFLNIKALRYQPDAVAHLEHAASDTGVESVVDSQAQGRLQFHGHIFAERQTGFIAGDAAPELCRSIGDVPHRDDAQLGNGCRCGILIRRQDVDVASDGAHLLHGRRLQILVDFLGIFAVLRIPGTHGLHLPALGIQPSVDILKWLFYAEPVDHVLAVQRLPNLVQIR